MKCRLFSWLLAGMALAGLATCSGDDEPALKTRRLILTETDNAAARPSSTRATLTDGNGLSASWATGDKLTYCNLSRVDRANDDAPYYGKLTAQSAAATSLFTGVVTCNSGDYLAVVYPATEFETNERYTIALSGQDGTLETLASNFHYVYGRARVTSVTDQTANAEMEKMKSLLTVCKFSFTDAASGSPIPIERLEISYYGDNNVSYAGKYPQTATVKTTDGNNVIKQQSDVHAEAEKTNLEKSLTVDCTAAQASVYVALLPDGERTYNFTVANSEGTYTGTATAQLREGKYVVATGLKLTKNN